MRGMNLKKMAFEALLYSLEGLLAFELVELKESGYGVDDAETEVEKVLKTEGISEKDAKRMFDEVLRKLEKQEDFKYEEPSNLEKIMEKSSFERSSNFSMSDPKLYNRIHGGFAGRIAGCVLGKPVEGFESDKIMSFLEESNAYPLSNYFCATNKELTKKYNLHTEGFKGNFSSNAAPRDDDIDFTILNLILLEKYGRSFSTENVGENWLENMPFYQVFTAERIAYRNLVNGMHPPHTAMYMNPYREWIGAQIRADIFGWTSPNNPGNAAKLAYKDAVLSHDKNGIYGEIFVAAMLASTFTSGNIREVVDRGLNHVPKNSRLHEALLNVIEWHEMNHDWRKTFKKIKEKYGHYFWVHVINNAAIVTMALLYSEGNFDRGITIAVQSGWDTDCNGATVGSILGTYLGYDHIPSKWIEPFDNKVLSYIPGYSVLKISDVAKRIFNRCIEW